MVEDASALSCGDIAANGYREIRGGIRCVIHPSAIIGRRIAAYLSAGDVQFPTVENSGATAVLFDALITSSAIAHFRDIAVDAAAPYGNYSVVEDSAPVPCFVA